MTSQTLLTIQEVNSSVTAERTQLQFGDFIQSCNGKLPPDNEAPIRASGETSEGGHSKIAIRVYRLRTGATLEFNVLLMMADR